MKRTAGPLCLVLLVSLVPRPAEATHLAYGYSLDRFTVSGTQLGSFTDEFSDGVLAPWTNSLGTATEAGGVAVMSNPGSDFNGAERSDINLGPLTWGGYGNFVATASWINAIPAPSQMYGFYVSWQTGPANVSQLLAVTTAPPGGSVPAGQYLYTQTWVNGAPGSIAAIPLAAAGFASPHVLLRLTYSDATGQMAFSLSLDEGASYVTPFAAFTPGIPSGSFGIIASALPEPSSVALCALGLLALAARKRVTGRPQL